MWKDLEVLIVQEVGDYVHLTSNKHVRRKGM